MAARPNHKPMTGGFDLPITTPPPNYKIHQLSLSRNSPLLSRNSPLGLYPKLAQIRPNRAIRLNVLTNLVHLSKGADGSSCTGS